MSSQNDGTAVAAPRVGRSASLALPAVILTTFLAASAAPTPLYRLYQESWSLSAGMVTLVFAVYAFALLGALLTVGKLSDHIGRRPVILAALLLDAVAMLLFALADGVPMLLAARVVQGIATGAATAALGAALIDRDRHRGPVVNGVSPMVGMAVGALGSGALVAWGPEPLHLVYVVLLAGLLLLAVLTAGMTELARPRPGAFASLRPAVAVPRQARATLLRLTPLNVALWGLGGFFLSLVPALVRQATGATSPLLGAAVVATLTLSGGAAILLARTAATATILKRSTAALVIGLVGVVGGAHSGAIPLLFGATMVAGLGFGASFLGILRLLMPLAGPDERAALLAALYVESYLAFSLPVVLAGLLVQSLGLLATTDLYVGALLILALAGTGALWPVLRPVRAAAA